MVDMPRPGEPFGRYRIVRALGHGGMGSVYEARQESLGRSVALKVLLPQFSGDAGFRARFTREAHALASLDSPHVIQVYEHGEEGGQLFIATQLVHGLDLEKLVSERGLLPRATALDVAAQVAAGLADAHRALVLHRDIKPSNVLVRESDGELHAYLCDFGIARAEHDDHTATRGVIGTLGYMSPERHRGAAATVQSDVYALGCLLWVLVTGQLPYSGDSGMQVGLAHEQQPIPQLPGATASTAALNAILRRAMAKEPAGRYAQVAEMRRDLLAAAAGARTEGGAWSTGTDIRPFDPVTDVADTQVPQVLTNVVTSPDAAPRRRVGPLLAAAGLALAAVVGVSAAVLLGSGPDKAIGSAPTGTSTETPSEPQADTTPESAPSSEPTGTPSEQPAEPVTSTPSAATSTPTTSTPTTPAAPASTVDCWDGTTAPTREGCALPAGAAGMQTVFPSMVGCQSVRSTVAGKVEVYECGYGDFLLRYTRWQQGFDRYGYLDAANQVAGAEWYADGEFAGRQWTSYEDDPNEREPYQWSATYRLFPYSVSVEGISADARQRGIAAVTVTAPSRVALR